MYKHAHKYTEADTRFASVQLTFDYYFHFPEVQNQHIFPHNFTTIKTASVHS